MFVSRFFYLLGSISDYNSTHCLLFSGKIPVMDINYPMMDLFNVTSVAETFFCDFLMRRLNIY